MSFAPVRIRETCVSVNNNLCGKFLSSLDLPTTFDERYKVPSVQLFMSDFNFLSSELDNFTFKVLYLLYWYYIKAKQNCNTFMVSYEKSKLFSSASLIIQNIVVFPSLSRLPLIWYFDFGLASSFFLVCLNLF